MENEKPLISIVVLNFNGLQFIKRTIPKLFELHYENYEIIVIDNGSTDGSVDYIKSINSIIFLESKRIGEKNYACNLAISNAKGEYILLLDNDLLINDSYILDKLINYTKTLNNVGTISLAYTNENETYSKGYGCYFSYYYSWEKPNLNLSIIKKMNMSIIGSPNGSGFFIKKSIWDAVGGYDDFLPFGGDDDDLGIKLWLQGYKNYLFSESIQTHIGIETRTNTLLYSQKFGKKVFAHLYTIVKNFNFHNMVLTLIGYTLFILLKSIKQSIDRKNLLPFRMAINGYYNFIKNIPYALKKRRFIQSNRKIKKDIFLKIRPNIKTLK